MAGSSGKKPTKKVTGVAAQAAAAVGPIKNRAGELAGAAAAAAAPRTAHAKERAVGIAEKAGAIGAKSVTAVAGGLDKVTGGKLAKPINAVSSAIEERIHPDKITPTPRTESDKAP